MDFAWSDQQRELLDAVGRFASQQLNYNVIENDRDGVFNHDAWKKCGRFGIQGLPVPTEYGGLGMDPLTTVAALERLGYACKDNGLLFSINAHLWTAVTPLVYNGSEAQKKKYLPGLCNGTLIGGNAMSEPNSGSDAFSLTTTAVKKGSKYILNGSKIFVTNGPVADLLVVFATVDKTRGPAGISASAPNRASDARVCIDRTTPTAKPAAAISGMDRHPSSNNWRSVSLTSNGGRNASVIARPANTPQSPAISSSESSVRPIRPIRSKQFVGQSGADEQGVRALVALRDLAVLEKRHSWVRDHVPGEHVDGEASAGVIPDVDPGPPRKARIHPQREDSAGGEIVGLETIEGIARHYRQVERQAFAAPRVAHAAHHRLDGHASEASGLISARKQIDGEPVEVNGGRQARPRAESHERPP